jgi:hypothetical protein
VFFIYLRRNSDLCHLQHKLIGFYNTDKKCLQRGKDWVFKYSNLHFVFGIYLKTNSDLCHLQHKLIGFYNRDKKCLQRGTDWVFKYSSLRFVFKRLKEGTGTSLLSVRIGLVYVYPVIYIVYIQLFA